MSPLLIALLVALLTVAVGGGALIHRSYYRLSGGDVADNERGSSGAAAVGVLVIAILAILFLIYGGFTFFHWFNWPPTFTIGS